MKLLRVLLLIIILSSIAVFCYFSFQSDTRVLLLEFLEVHAGRHLWLVLILFALILLSTITGLPVFYFGIAFGFFFPFIPALFFTWLFGLVSIIAIFLILRSVYASYFIEKYGTKKVIKKVNAKIEKHGFWTVAISRSIYIIPTNLINFVFPLSKISGRQYVLGTMAGLVPESLINVLTGLLLKQQLFLLTSAQQNLLKTAIIGAALGVMAIVLVFIYYRRRNSNARINEIVPRLKD